MLAFVVIVTDISRFAESLVGMTYFLVCYSRMLIEVHLFFRFSGM